MGLGLSGFASMYHTAHDEMQAQGLVDFTGASAAGSALYLAVLGAALLLGSSRAPVALACLSPLLVGSLAFVASLWRHDPYRGARTVYVIAGEFGNGDERKRHLGDKYSAAQKRVNEILGALARARPPWTSTRWPAR